MRVLVIGSGGREHAILWGLKRTAERPLDLFCAPGNGGINQISECVPVSAGDIDGLIKFARDQKIDLTFVGPEAPLVEGIVDRFDEAGLRIVGPSRAASRLEGSKAFSKDFMDRHGIPTAPYHVASSPSEAIEVLNSGKFGSADSPVVLKADGLAAGKGVIVARSRGDGIQAVRDLTGGALIDANAASQIVIEEALDGREVSVLLFADGKDYALMPPARDHKRIGEHDTGPNTGGMGAITDPSVIDDEFLARVVVDIVEPTLRGARGEGFPFKGVLFIGLMLTKDGPKVLEYNVRFGDPETQAIMVRLESSLCEVFQAISDERLDGLNVRWSQKSSACVVLASEGYPAKYKTGLPIDGLDTTQEVEIFHAGTAINNGQFLTAGGRVLGVTAVGDGLEDALNRCYAAISQISWPGMRFRRDIGSFSARASSP